MKIKSREREREREKEDFIRNVKLLLVFVLTVEKKHVS